MITNAVLHTCAKEMMAEMEDNGERVRKRTNYSFVKAPVGDPASGIYGRLRVTGEGSTLFSILSRLVILGLLYHKHENRD